LAGEPAVYGDGAERFFLDYIPILGMSGFFYCKHGRLEFVHFVFGSTGGYNFPVFFFGSRVAKI
jgi:hypothetical protein